MSRFPSVLFRFLSCVATGLLGAWTAGAAITVNGISDEDIETDRASFTIPSESGFTIVGTLNGAPVGLDSPVEVATPGYYELEVRKTDDLDGSEEMALIQFIVLDSSRGTSERGLVNWTPYPTIDSAAVAFEGASLEAVMPTGLPRGFDVPVILRLRDGGSGTGLRLNATVEIPERRAETIRLLRGFGSGFLGAPTDPGTYEFTPTVHGLSVPVAVEVEENTSWTVVGSDLTSSADWGENARVHVTSDLTIADGVTLRIGAGSVIQLDPGVDIQLDGVLEIEGTPAAPVLFANVPGQSYWGGFFLQGANSRVTASGAIFTGSGADQDWFDGSGYSSHRDEQATFLVDGVAAGFTDCFFLDLAGQALHGRDGMIELTDCLVQRVPTVGQFNGGAVTVRRTALLEFPRNDAVFTDDDNDGIYFTVGTHQLLDSVIGWAKDDGVDAGSGSSGNVAVENCWFEACYHEGMAWSGGGRSVTVNDSVVVNSGQGIEAGWSDSADSPLVTVSRSLCVGNHVGWRYGDNYDWDYDGQLHVADSLSLFNDRNVWGFEWSSWDYRIEKMTIENNHLSAPEERHPANTLWDPIRDAALLAPFSPRPGVAVGCGFGEWTLQKPASAYGGEVVLSLSEFRGAPVRVRYEVVRDETVLGTGTVEFLPGEIRKGLPLPTLDRAPERFVRVTLTGVEGAEITTARNLFFLASPGVAGGPSTLVARGSEWRYLDDGSDPGPGWQDPGHDDSSWASGAAQLGYGDGDEATVVNDRTAGDQLIATTFFRRSFTVPDPSLYGELEIHLLRDDGAIVHLNGEEVFRSNIDAGAIGFDEFSGNVTSGSDEDLYFTKVIPASHLRAGANVLAVEVHQANDTSSDVSFDLELIGMPPIPVVFLLVDAGGELTLVWQADEGVMLQSSPDLADPWTSLPESVSPLILTPGRPDARRFFRLAR